MTSHVKPIPDGYHSVTPVLQVDGAAKLIDFLKQAFGALEKERFTDPTGKDPPRGGHDRGLDRAVERRGGGVEADPSAAAPVRDGHRRDVPTGPQSRCDLPAGADGRVLRRPERGCQGRFRQLVVDRYPPTGHLPRRTREARGGPAEKVASVLRTGTYPRGPSHAY